MPPRPPLSALPAHPHKKIASPMLMRVPSPILRLTQFELVPVPATAKSGLAAACVTAACSNGRLPARRPARVGAAHPFTLTKLQSSLASGASTAASAASAALACALHARGGQARPGARVGQDVDAAHQRRRRKHRVRCMQPAANNETALQAQPARHRACHARAAPCHQQQRCVHGNGAGRGVPLRSRTSPDAALKGPAAHCPPRAPPPRRRHPTHGPRPPSGSCSPST